ncbi:hypothetical protein NA66_100651 [Burkholderia pyrrocinia]|uniref:Uncharacterized protein n=1 Tax=Burkholderia pyrrocinia TaxID=60550 RepID=A0A318IN29_BURPY|nr:hypothetical protein NA66_100651 [Burkholderia pyrrocinia]SFW42159.1 hypothetical protein SAMN03159384_01947 [Burkholderia sp. NFACC33-1]SFX72185.1 hypothetical protein SAMN03159408_02029 [Burkholderia sp. NFPP32]
MFFLFLLGRARSEKNCAAFYRDLREFSRAVVERDWRGVGTAGWFAGTTGAGPKTAGRRGGGRSRLVRQGFQRSVAVTLTIEMHSIPIGRGRGMSTMLRPSADRDRALTVRAHSVSSGVGGGMSTSEIGIRFARAPMLTVEIHSAASGFRRWISTSGSARFVDPRFTLTDRIHRIASGFVDRTFTPEHLRCAIARALSPLKYTALRVAAVVVIHRPNRPCRPVSRAPSPLKTTALRVTLRGGYPHGRESVSRPAKYVSEGHDDRKSTPASARCPIGRRHSPSKYTVPRVVWLAGYPHENPRCPR